MPLLTTVGAASTRGFGTFGGAPEDPPTVIGQPYGGGFFAGLISATGSGVATHYLVVAPKALGESSSQQWKTTSTSTAGTGSVIAGPTNTGNMNNAFHPAAFYTRGLSINGFGDWYLPARDELEACYFNLKPTTTLNDTASGTNFNAVPSRAGSYATDNPLQTSVELFQSGNSEAFAPFPYWASTEFSSSNAWYQDFDNGQQTNANKQVSLYVRAVRRVPV
jgi:hypothetical protein